MKRRAINRFLAVLAAYLVMLHALGMAAMAAPAAQGPLLVLCSLESQQTAPGAPHHGTAEHVPCGLCGLGAGAVAPPPSDAIPQQYAPAAVAPPIVMVELAAPQSVVDSARPRGPPRAA